MAKKNPVVKTVTHNIPNPRSYDPMAMEERIYNLEKSEGGGGGSSTLSGLTDVDISTPSNGQVLTYDSTSQKWENAAAPSGSSSLDSLTDVDISTPSNGQVLTYNSTSEKWENAAAPSGGSHSYSTSEQVVGKWTDNSNVYEKTYTGLTVAVTANQWKDTGITLTGATQIIGARILFSDTGATYDAGITMGSVQLKSDESVSIIVFGNGTITGIVFEYLK